MPWRQRDGVELSSTDFRAARIHGHAQADQWACYHKGENVIFFVRAWYGFLGLVGRFLHWLIIEIPMIRQRNACNKNGFNEFEELYSKYYYGISWDGCEEVDKNAAMYALLTKCQKSGCGIEMHDKKLSRGDDYDLHRLYETIGYIKEIISR